MPFVRKIPLKMMIVWRQAPIRCRLLCLWIALVRALSADYFISASDGSHTASSNEVSLTVDTANRMIGCFKISNFGNDDQFGYSVALSEAGSTLAVGAPYKDADIQIGTIDEGKGVSSSGEVYLY
ncbi:hypothetical protein FG067_17865 [Vibrio cholerae]|nr:hypothetical protein [Vibrio cholerae]